MLWLTADQETQANWGQVIFTPLWVWCRRDIEHHVFDLLHRHNINTMNLDPKDSKKINGNVMFWFVMSELKSMFPQKMTGKTGKTETFYCILFVALMSHLDDLKDLVTLAFIFSVLHFSQFDPCFQGYIFLHPLEWEWRRGSEVQSRFSLGGLSMEEGIVQFRSMASTTFGAPPQTHKTQS